MIFPMKKLLLPLLLVALTAARAADAPQDFPKPDAFPRPLKQTAPVYPYGLKAAGIIGRVTVDAVLDTDGKVAEVHVARSNNPFFERAAIDAVMKWEFSPATKAGRPVKCRIRQEINFQLDGMNADTLWRIEPPRDWGKVPEAYRWDIAPEPVGTLMAAYPFEALQANQGGKVTISYVIDREGRVAMAKVREATAPELGAAILAMIDGWRFKPARKSDGTPAYAVVSLTREFAPNGRGDVPVSDSAKWIVGRLAKNKLECAKPEELDAPLKPVSTRPPTYPTALREAGQDGEAVIEFYLDERGDAQLPRVVSATAPEFGYSAVQAVATWRFMAPRKAGKGVVVRVQQAVKFHLKEPIKPPPAEFVP